MPGLPTAQLLTVDHERGLRRCDVLCPYCNRVHHHRLPGDDAAFTATAACSRTLTYRVALPGRDDNAIDVPANNWEE